MVNIMESPNKANSIFQISPPLKAFIKTIRLNMFIVTIATYKIRGISKNRC